MRKTGRYFLLHFLFLFLKKRKAIKKPLAIINMSSKNMNQTDKHPNNKRNISPPLPERKMRSACIIKSVIAWPRYSTL